MPGDEGRFQDVTEARVKRAVSAARREGQLVVVQTQKMVVAQIPPEFILKMAQFLPSS